MECNKNIKYRVSLLYIILIISCNSVYTPKPAGYFNIKFPPHAYQRFQDKNFPYMFEYPVYARIIHDTTFFEDKPENPFWINIDFTFNFLNKTKKIR